MTVIELFLIYIKISVTTNIIYVNIIVNIIFDILK